MLYCDSSTCWNTPTHYDLTHNLICEECLAEEIEVYGNDPEDYEKI